MGHTSKYPMPFPLLNSIFHSISIPNTYFGHRSIINFSNNSLVINHYVNRFDIVGLATVMPKSF